jgi:hypothetical protein
MIRLIPIGIGSSFDSQTLILCITLYSKFNLIMESLLLLPSVILSI